MLYEVITIVSGNCDFNNVNDPNTLITNITFPLVLNWNVVGGGAGSCNGGDQVTITKTTTTQANISSGDIMVSCSDNFYNGLTADFGPNIGAGETSLWYQTGGSNVVFSSANNSQTTNITNLNLPGVHTIV